VSNRRWSVRGFRVAVDEIATRLVAATERAERLRTRLAKAEDDLDRVRMVEQVVKE
jgi:hypothetical protein